MKKSDNQAAMRCIIDSVTAIESAVKNEPSEIDDWFKNPQTDEMKMQTILQNCKAIREYIKMIQG